MKQKVIYQTLENRGNPEEIEQNGPFKCHWENTWLGIGYYFWDTFIENAHWWGNNRGYKNGYVICKANCSYDVSNCFDLVGNTEHILKFRDSFLLMKKQGLINKDTTVARVLQFIRQDIKIFIFEAIRINGIHSKEKFDKYSLVVHFEKGKIQYFDSLPAIQICIFKKNGLNLKNYHIVYPEDYIESLWI